MSDELKIFVWQFLSEGEAARDVKDRFIQAPKTKP
jgi:hypothetical protein